MKINGKNFYKDGRTKEILDNKILQRLYYTWIGIRRRAYGRCFKDNDRHKKIYANIGVAPEWEDWNVFKEWAFANGYASGLSIDRIDGCKGYFPSNCRWVTRADNNRNKIKTKLFEYEGEKLTLGQIADKNNMSRCLLYSRVINYGWDLKKAITEKIFSNIETKKTKTRVRNTKMQEEFDNGDNISVLAKKYNMSERNVYDCIVISPQRKHKKKNTP